MLAIPVDRGIVSLQLPTTTFKAQNRTFFLNRSEQKEASHIRTVPAGQTMSCGTPFGLRMQPTFPIPSQHKPALWVSTKRALQGPAPENVFNYDPQFIYLSGKMRVCMVSCRKIKWGDTAMTDTQRRAAAKQFAADWQGKGYEITARPFGYLCCKRFMEWRSQTSSSPLRIRSCWITLASSTALSPPHMF